MYKLICNLNKCILDVDMIQLRLNFLKRFTEERSTMARNWQDLLKLTQGEMFAVERVRLSDGETAIEGNF